MKVIRWEVADRRPGMKRRKEEEEEEKKKQSKRKHKFKDGPCDRHYRNYDSFPPQLRQKRK